MSGAPAADQVPDFDQIDLPVHQPGKGAAYRIAFTDGQGTPLFGGGALSLKSSGEYPRCEFRSVTLHEAENASGRANGQPFPSLGSRDKPAENDDGSTDLYFGPQAPEGKGEKWLATVSGKGYFAIIRLNGPTEPAIEKHWKPGDFERIESACPVLPLAGCVAPSWLWCTITRCQQKSPRSF